MDDSGRAGDNKDTPAMSVVVIAPDCYDTIRRTVEHLRAQTARDRLELLIVAPAARALQDRTSQLEGFARVRVIEVGGIKSTAQANAAGVRAASGPVVAFVEQHVYPEPHWAEALIGAHQESWAVVGPVVGNANPGSLVSWTDLIVGYSPWLEFTPAGEVEHLPAHNSSYKREVLLEYDHELEAALAVESVLHWALRRRGYRLYLERGARVRHLNTSRPSSLLRGSFLGGRLFGGVRAKRWSPARRLLYASAAPFIPAVRLGRIIRHVVLAGRRLDIPAAVAPLVVLALGVSAIGELTGYALGEGNAQEMLCDLELHRERYVRRQDREDLEG